VRFLFFLAFLISLSIRSNGQILEHRIESFAKEQKIDSFLIYTISDSDDISPDSCLWEKPHYLFWQQKGQWFTKKFDYCQTFKKVLLDSINPLKFYLLHKSKIEKEEILLPEYHQTVTRKGRKEVHTVTLQAGHQLSHKFQFFVGGGATLKYAGKYDLELSKFDNGERNINYPINQKTKLKALIDITSKLIKYLNDEKRHYTE
jgi:hypothetical protein